MLSRHFPRTLFGRRGAFFSPVRSYRQTVPVLHIYQLGYSLPLHNIRDVISHKQGQSFSKDNYTAAFPKTWSFTSFCPSSINCLDAAIDWLKSYASRHSFMDNPPILNDFDEHYQHFDPVEF